MPLTSGPKNPKRRRALKGLMTLPLLPLAVGAEAAKRGIAGRMAPELHADFWIDADGESTQFSLTEQRGRWVHVKCWQSWCPGCHSQGFPTLQRMVKAFAGDPRVVNVALQTVFEGHGVNSAEKVRKTQLQYDLPIKFGHDPGEDQPHGTPKTMVAYRTGGTPWHILVDPEGRVIYNGFNMDADAAIAFIQSELANS